MERILPNNRNCIFYYCLLLLIGLLAPIQYVNAQGGIIGSGFSSGWTNPGNISRFSSSASSTGILTTTGKGTGNQYFRVVNSSNSELQASPQNCSNDQLMVLGTSQALTGSCGKALYINVPNTTDNYVFKADNQNSPSKVVMFRVQGSISTISGVTRDLSTVYIGQTPTVTVTLNATLPVGQGLYIRYTTNGFSSSTVAAMSVSGTTGTFTIPSQTSGTTVTYYCFTSGSGLSIASADADYYTINLNNGGSNYSYTVNGAYITASGATNWTTSASWAAGVPPTGADVIIAHPLTLNTSTTVNSISISSGVTFTGADGTARTLSISGGGTFANAGTFTSTTNNTISFTSGGTINGASATTFNNLTVGGGGMTLSTIPSIAGTLQINVGGFFNQTPIYLSGSTLAYNVDYGPFNEWTSTTAGAAGSGRPDNVSVLAGTLSMPNTTRTLAGNLSLANGTTLTLNATSGDLMLGGNWNNNGATFNTNQRAVWFTGSGTQTISKSGGETFTYLLLNNTGTVKLGSAVTINGTSSSTFQILNTGGLDLNGNNLTFSADGGNIQVGSTGTISNTGSSANVNFNGNTTLASANTQAFTLGTGVLLNLAASKTFTLNGKDLNLNGTFSAGSGAGIVGNTASNISIGGTGSFGTLAFSGTLQLKTLTINRTSSGDVKLGSNLTLNATSGNSLILTNGNLDLNGTNILTIPSAAPISESSNGRVYNSGNTTSGYITTSGTINNATVNLGGLGFSISTTANLGTVTINRYHSIRSVSGGSSNSINRFYSVAVGAAGTATTVTMQYDVAELNSNTETSPNLALFSGIGISAGYAPVTATNTVTSGYPRSLSIGSNNLTTTALYFTAANAPSGYLTATGATDWNTGSSWAAGYVPPDGSSVNIAHNLTLAGSAIAANVTINNGVALTLGTTGNLTINVSGTLSNSSTSNLGSGTITFAGSGTLGGTVAPIFNNLTLGNGTLNLNFIPTINGTLTLNSGSVLSGTPIYGSSSTLVYAASTTPALEWTATTDGVAGSGLPNNVTINSGATVTMPANSRAMAGNLTIAGALTMNATSGADLSLRGSWTNSAGNAAFTQNGRTVSFLGTSASTFNTTGGGTFSNLIINNSGGLQLQSNLSISASGSLALAAGALSRSGSQTLTLGNNAGITRQAGSLGFTPSYGTGITLTYSGNVAVNSGGELAAGPGTINISNTASTGVTLTQNISSGNVSLTSGAVLTLGNFVLNGTSGFSQTGGTVFYSGTSGLGNVFAGSGTLSISAGTINLNGGSNNTLGLGSLALTAFQNATLVLSNGTNFTLNGSATFGSISIGSGSTFTASDSTARNLTLTSGATFTNNGTFTPGGKSNIFFPGSITLAGSNAFTFDTIALTGQLSYSNSLPPVINGKFRMNGGGFTNNTTAPTYAANSILEYNSTTYNVSNEWTANTDGPAGSGRPHHVNFLVGTATMPSTTRSLAGNLTISNGAGLNLSSTSGADLMLRGNWTNNGGTFNANGRAVWFNGTSTQTVYKSGGETFAYLIINKASNNLKLLSDITISASVANILQFGYVGGLDLNNQSLNLNSSGGNILTGNISGSTDTNSTRYITGTGNINISGGVSSVKTVVNNNSKTLTIGPNVTVNLSAGWNCGSNLTNLNGTLKIYSSGYITNNAPVYGSTSTLEYALGTSYGQGLEWNNSSLQNVVVSNGSQVYFNAAPRVLAGNLTITGTNSLLSLNGQNGALTVGGSVNVSSGGTLTLSTQPGGDLNVGGDFNFTNSYFNNNNRAVTFTGNGAQSLSASGSTLAFQFLRVNKASGILTLNSGITLDYTNNSGLSIAELAVLSGGLNLNGQTITRANLNTIPLLRVSAGYLYLGGTSLSLFSRFSNSSTLSNFSDSAALSGRVVISGTSQSINSGLKYKSLYVAGSGSQTLAGNITVSDTLFVQTGATLDLGVSSAVVSVKKILNNNGTITGSGTGTITLNGTASANRIIGSGTVNKLIVSNPSGATVSGRPTISQALTLTSGILATESSADTVVLGSLAILTESSSAPTNYVLGNLRTSRVVGTSASIFGGIGVSLTAGADLGTVSVVRISGSGAGGNSPCCTTSTGINRYWFIRPTQQPAVADRNLTLSWPIEDDNSKDLTTAQVYKRTDGNSPWKKLGTSQNISATFPRSITINGISSFSDWTISDDANPLPITLTWFKAEAVGKNNALLTWQTASENNNEGFRIEKSEDGRNFAEIGFVGGVSESNSLKNYSFADNTLRADAWYRLQQIDKDGQITTIQPVFLRHNSQNKPFGIAPNPGRTDFKILGDRSAALLCSLNITDASGKIQFEGQGNLSQLEFALNRKMEGLKPGIYFLHFVSESTNQTLQLVKE